MPLSDQSSTVNTHIWPTAPQQLLLQAILNEGQPGLEAWNEWKAIFEDGLDLGSYRLLPLLYRSLQRRGVDDPLLGRLKGIYRKTWVENQIHFKRAAQILALLNEAGISPLLLKGSALTLFYYQDPGLRPMNDIDVLVPLQDRERAIRILVEAGFSPEPIPIELLSPASLDLKHAHQFVHPDGTSIDLHWHVLFFDLGPQTDCEFWQRAVPAKLQGAACQTLDPADLLLHVCTHGMSWDVGSTVRWIPDAITILRTKADDLDWDYLVEQANRHRCSLALATTLDYLQQNFAASIPGKTLLELHQLPKSWQERLEFAVMSRHSNLVGYLPRLWTSYLRLKGLNDLRGLAGFLKYIQVKRGDPDLKTMLRWAAARVITRIKNKFRSGMDYRIEKRTI